VATEPNNRRAGKLARTGPSQSEQIKTLQQDRLRGRPGNNHLPPGCTVGSQSAFTSYSDVNIIPYAVSKRQAFTQSSRAAHTALLSFVSGLVVAVLGFFLDRILLREGVPRFDLLLIINGITGLIAGGLLYQRAHSDTIEREFMRERIRTVAELNHHIRNALQVIKFWGVEQSTLGKQQVGLIHEAADRIEWALREVVPLHSATSVRFLAPPEPSGETDGSPQERKPQ
jgi:F0F1-type ATP synthase assembly protein I